jgi:hypothetical protein
MTRAIKLNSPGAPPLKKEESKKGIKPPSKLIEKVN